jgi:enhancer of polycomb-like protein
MCSDSVAPPAHPEIVIRPKERAQTIRDLIEKTFSKQKEADHHWEDQIDVRLLSFLSYM